MACAVGGCAGCTVRVNTPDGPAMKRVCVDGPVFDRARCSAKRDRGEDVERPTSDDRTRRALPAGTHSSVHTVPTAV